MKKLTYYCYIFALLLFVQGFPSNDYILTINGGLKEQQTLSSNPINDSTTSREPIRIIISLPDGSFIDNWNNCTNNNTEPRHELVRTYEPNTPWLDDKCVSNIDCLNVSYSECILGKCLCQPNYTPLDGRCFGLIDEACELDSDCGVGGSECKFGFCKCKPNYYASDNKKCHRLAQSPGNFGDHNQGSRELKHLTCFDDHCECESNYQRKGNLCLGLMNATCLSNQDCAITNSICFQNTCQCPTNYYFENNYCYQFADKHYTPADPATAYLRFNNSIFKNNQSECLEGYYRDGDECFQIPSGPGIVVGTCKACDYLTDGYYADRKCHIYARNFNDSCYDSTGCKIDYSICSNGKCVCKPNYISHNDVCYGFPNAECTKPSDCLSSSYSCVSGTCQNVGTCVYDNCISEKPGITSYWISYMKVKDTLHRVYAGDDGLDDAVYVCRVDEYDISVPGMFLTRTKLCYVNINNNQIGRSSYNLLMGDDVEWKKTNFTLDKAIFGGFNRHRVPYLSCRVNITSEIVATGNLEPPLYNKCFIPYARKVTPYETFDILVHK